MIIVDTTNTEHYKWGEGCDGWRFVNSDSLSVIREKMLPKTQEQLHYHKKAQQFFYVISGTATFEIDNELIEVVRDKGLWIKPGMKHKISNQTDADLEFLVISQPKSHGDRINLE